MTNFEELNKGPLLELIKENGLEAEVEALGKHESKVTKADLVEILNANVETPVEKQEVKKELPKEPVDRGEKADDYIKEEFAKLGRIVIVTDHQTKTSTEEEVIGKVMEVQIGNNIIGKERHVVLLDGQPQLLANAVIRKLGSIMMTSVSTPAGNTKEYRLNSRKRFSIAEVTAPTEEELKALAEKQKLHIKR